MSWGAGYDYPDDCVYEDLQSPTVKVYISSFKHGRCRTARMCAVQSIYPSARILSARTSLSSCPALQSVVYTWAERCMHVSTRQDSNRWMDGTLLFTAFVTCIATA